jgi:hypothetical protein
MRRLFLTVSVFALYGCAEFSGSTQLNEPKTTAEILSGYNYVPLDPLPVNVLIHPNCEGQKIGKLFEYLPDNAVRIAMRQLTANGSLGFGPAKLGYKGSTYQVVLDFINDDVAYMRLSQKGGDLLKGTTPTFLKRVDNPNEPTSQDDIYIPVYVGIGLRLTANVTVHSGTVNLSSLGALSAAADAQRITGSLIVQTLGITGPKVMSSLPLPSDLNSTTVQNAILALGTIKAIVNDPDTLVTPRVTGIYDPLPNPNQQTINQIVTALSRDPVPWYKICPTDKPVQGVILPPPPPPNRRGERGL